MKAFTRIVTALAFLALVSSRLFAATSIQYLPEQNLVPTLFDAEGKFQPTTYVNVLAYGADTNGVSDSRTAFVNALAAVPSGGVLYVPRGVYKWSSGLTLAKSHFKILGDFASFKFSPGAITDFAWIWQGDDIAFSGITFDANSLARIGCYHDVRYGNIEYRKCTFTGELVNNTIDPGATLLAAGLWFSRGTHDAYVHDCTFSNIVDVLSGASRASRGIVISDNGYTVTLDQCKRFRVYNNHFTGIGPSSNGDPIAVITQYNSYDGTLTSEYDVDLIAWGNHAENNGKRTLGKVIGCGTQWYGNEGTAMAGQLAAILFAGRNHIAIANKFTGPFTDKFFEIGTGPTGPEITGGLVIADNYCQSIPASASSHMIHIHGGAQNSTLSANRGRDIGNLLWGQGRIWGLQVPSIGGTNIAGTGVYLDTDGTYAPSDVDVGDVLIKGAGGAALNFAAGTNLYWGNVKGGTISIGSGIPAFGPNGERTVRQTADQSITSSTTLADATMGAITIEASKKYRWFAHLMINEAGTAAGVKVAVTGPASPTDVICTGMLEQTTSGVLHQTVNAYATIINGTVSTTGTKYVNLYGEVNNGTTRGDLKIQIAQNVSDANATTLKVGSWLTVNELNQ